MRDDTHDQPDLDAAAGVDAAAGTDADGNGHAASVKDTDTDADADADTDADTDADADADADTDADGAAENDGPPDDRGLTIVGIGASAGGLGALKALLAAMPPRTGVAFVVVVHLSPEHESHLSNLLQPHCAWPVQQVTETMPLEPDHVYVIPPGANLEAIDTHLRLSDLEARRSDRAPIDHFFRTLASTHDGNSIGIVLTGTGSDGTLGLRHIKDNGGVTLVQSPEEAEYDGMPRSAVAGGDADFVLPLAQMPARIVEIARTEPRLPADPDAQPGQEQERTLRKVFAQIRARTGHDFHHYKRSTIVRRIRRRMQMHQIPELEDYLDLLRGDREEVVALYRDLLITVTEFFRDAEVFQRLQDTVLPELFEGKRPDEHVRVWSVGCSTGEEAYSLTMLLLEEHARHPDAPLVQVFASDLHEKSLRTAREGVYPESIAGDLSPQRLARFFTRDNGSYVVRSEVRELVVFAPHNLIGDPPFSHVDLIVCRNLLIYLQREVQRDVLTLFHYALNPEGLLLLGTSETVDGSEQFLCEHKGHSLYRRRNVPTREPRLPVFPLAPGAPGAPVRDAAPAVQPVSFGSMHAKAVERYAPPSILVNENHNVVHYSAHAGRYLTMPGGEPTNNVFKLVREPLRVELRSVLYTAKEDRRNTRSKPIAVEIDGAARQVVVRVRPAADAEMQGFLLIIFDELDEAPPGIDRQAGGAVDSRELEAELDQNKRRLQAVIEEYETGQEEMQASNEELQSANEELRSTMEELETSKEELQSMNEELATVNQENRHRVEELGQLSNDLQNLLAATDIATLFLDRQLRIVRFTPALGELFNVRHSDRGRPLSDLTHKLDGGGLADEARRVLDDLVPVEREIRSHQGRWYLTRLRPYRSADDRIEGVVVTLIDITARKDAEQTLRRGEERLRVSLDAAGMGVWEVVEDEDFGRIDDIMCRLFGWPQGTRTMAIADLYRRVHPDDRDELVERVRQGWDDGVDFDAEFRILVDGQVRWLVGRGRVMGGGAPGADGRPRRMLGVNYEITQRRAVEQDLRDSEERLKRLNDSLEQHVAERTAELQRQTARLRRLAGELASAEHRERRRLAALLHDDLQQYLVAAKMRLVALRPKLADATAAEAVGDAIDLLDESLDATSDLTRQLRPPVLYEEGLLGALRWLATEVKRLHGIDVTVHAECPEPQLADDLKVLLFEAVRELLLNVVKHAGVDAATVTVEGDDDGLSVHVEDGGVGFDLDDLADNPDHGGQGLYSIRERLAALDGQMTVRSIPGDGVKVGVSLPAIAPMPQLSAPAAEIPPDADTGGRVRVLVADDHSAFRAGIAGVLAQDDRLVLVGQASDGYQAVEAVDRVAPDVALMDVNMPDLNGVEATRAIRRRFPRVRVIGLSVQNDAATAQAMLDAGATSFLSKSAAADRIVQAILAAVGRR